MDVVERLIAAVKASKSKQRHIAADANMPPAKLSKIVNRKQVPTVPEFIAIARAIGIEPSRLFSGAELVVEAETLRNVHSLSAKAAQALQQLTEQVAKLLPVQTSAPVDLRKPQPDRDAVPIPAAANPNAELLVERETNPKKIPRRAWNLGARIIVRVVGDSMDGGADPIRNGELAYLKPTRSARNVRNEIALVRRDDALFLKLFEMSGSAIRLVSANPSLPPIVLDARGENLQIYGYVVAHGPES
jgi:SOS-response transcriptional repressor LexA